MPDRRKNKTRFNEPQTVMSQNFIVKSMVNAKSRVRRRKPMTPMQRIILQEAMDRKKEEIAQERDKPLERPDDGNND